jgi:serine/threonine-protein kinase
VSRSTDPFSAETLPPGTSLGRYDIRRLIGRGGMGCVYEAVHRDLKKRVAIKTLLPSLAASDEARIRFLREGEAASRIRHPNVVDVTDVGVEGETSYLVMEFLEGEDLAALIARQGALSIEQTADIMLPVAAAISSAHEQGVIHRDLKPANILLARSAVGGLQPKVLDFGISKVSGDRGTMVLTGTGATFGTTFYLPPEQLQGARQADARSDQYALGTIIYECVTGQRAFEKENLYGVLKDIAEGRYPTPLSRRPDLPPVMDALITRSMSLDPANRFESVKQLGAAMLEFASPQSRAMWTSFFGGVPLTGRGAPAYGAPGGTMLLQPEGAAALRKQVTPPPNNARGAGALGGNSTFRHATGESVNPFGSVPNLRRPSRVPLMLGVGVVAIAGGAFGVMRLLERPATKPTISDQGDVDKHVTPPSERPTFRVEIETEPHAATLELDGHTVGAGALDQRMPSDGVEHVLVARAPGYRDVTVRFTDRPPPHLLALDPVTAPNPNANTGDSAAHAADDDNRAAQDRPTHDRPNHDKPTAAVAGGRHHHITKGHADHGGPIKDSPTSGHGDPGLSSNGAPIIE